MNKVCLIKQPAGIGDIFVCLKIAKIIQAKTEYNKIIWPVASVYSYLNNYLIEKDILFCNEESLFEFKNVYMSNQMTIIKNDKLLYIPLQSSNYIMKSCRCHNNTFAFFAMKYDFCGISLEKWVDYFEFTRNLERESQLIKKLGIDFSVPFNLVNKNYGTFPNFITRNDIVPRNNFRNVNMNFIDGINIFDWIGVFEKAAEIHTVDTSIAYILEKLKLTNVFLYSRCGGKDFPCVQSLFNKSWTFIK